MMEVSLVRDGVLDESMGDTISVGNAPQAGDKVKRFYQLKTPLLSTAILFITVSQCTLAVLVQQNVININKTNITTEPIRSQYFLPYHFLLILQAVCWGFIAILDRIIHMMAGTHKKRGYVSFYASTKFIRRLPSYVMAVGNGFCLLIAGMWGDTPPPWDHLSPQLLVMLITCLETIAICPAVVRYIILVTKFNKARTPPDMEHYLGESNPIHIQVGNTRTQEELELLADKQSEIIHSLRLHNQVLAKRIMSLHRQIKA